MLTAARLFCGHGCRVKRFRERYYFWIPDASLGHRNALSVYQAAAVSRALYCSPTGHLDISTFRAGYPGADLRGSEHLPVQLFIYPECHKIDSQKFCPVRRWEGYPAFSLMCRWPNTTFHSLRCRGLWVRMFAYLLFRAHSPLLGVYLAELKVIVFTSEPRSSARAATPPPSLPPPWPWAVSWPPGSARTRLLPRDWPSGHRTELDPDCCPQAWHLELSVLPALLSPSVPAFPLRRGALNDVLLF